jgi:hypothetical protein
MSQSAKVNYIILPVFLQRKEKKGNHRGDGIPNLSLLQEYASAGGKILE